jgi:hypothetical protein
MWTVTSRVPSTQLVNPDRPDFPPAIGIHGSAHKHGFCRSCFMEADSHRRKGPTWCSS